MKSDQLYLPGMRRFVPHVQVTLGRTVLVKTATLSRQESWASKHTLMFRDSS